MPDPAISAPMPKTPPQQATPTARRGKALNAPASPKFPERGKMTPQARERHDNAPVRRSAVVVVLEAIPVAAFIVGPGGVIACANSAGRRALVQQGPALAAALGSALAGRGSTPAFTLREIAEADGGTSHLALLDVPAEAARGRADALSTPWGLTARQVEVLALLALGDANKTIAAVLRCAEVTAETHVTALLQKANVASRAALVARFWTERLGPTKGFP